MIIYDLNCDNNHRFEGWFQNAGAFESQLEERLVCCPQCDSHNVHRVPSVVAISGHHAEESVSTGSVISTKAPASTALMPVGTQAMALYRQLIQTIVSHSEDVGDSFADEARKIHYNEAPQRPIRGHASEDECDELRDEGIQVMSLPLPKDEDLN